MKVVIQPELFTPPVNHLALIEVFNHAETGRHRVEIDRDHPDVAEWLRQQSPGLQEEIRFALDVSTDAEPLEPARTVITIGRFHASDWLASPQRLTLSDARAVLNRPFTVLLEHDRTDRDFLLCMLSEEEREFFKSRERAGFLRVEKGGGLEDMEKRLTKVTADSVSAHLWWVLFDSDALQPGKPSASSNKVKARCHRILHHQLTRRFSESYITDVALHGWATGVASAKTRQMRLDRLRAFRRMSTAQRHHFNMKEGFAKDRERVGENAGSLYYDLTEEDRSTLQHGFELNIKKLFADGSVTEADLRRDGGWHELRPAICELMEMLR